ncbi:hypothetical protein UUU_28780 [Klebsiella pneumoniae subsp. pneumoniae DSM 30104 = JCM 1662 = NBRC 14940]|nr:hypothetical protein UUU_28780 [Klebsiella pneumoniae subsp. pneumoniae DSM 30104 = JCM 1662 = NBRC 14940]
MHQMGAPAHHYKHHQRTDGAGDNDRPQLGAQQIPVLHHPNADRHEQQRHIADQDITAGVDPLRRHNLQRQQHEEDQHADDAAGDSDRQQPGDKNSAVQAGVNQDESPQVLPDNSQRFTHGNNP